MRKTTLRASIILAASLVFAGSSLAQQTPPASAPAASGSATPAAKAQSGTATTPGTKAPASKTPAKPGTAAPLLLKTDKDKQSYAVGVNIGSKIAESMQRDGVDVNKAILARGIRDAVTGGKILMTDDEIKATLTVLAADLKKKAADIKKKQDEELAVAGSANKTAGDAFLAANKSKDGVVTLPSGLQYKIVTEGTGPKPAATDSVTCNYRGTLVNGTEFDSSYKRGQPATFPVDHVIKGWTEALQLMPVGSKWELYVPSELAYGPQSRGKDIGPNSTLIFEVELLSIEPKAAQQQPAAAAPASPKADTVNPNAPKTDAPKPPSTSSKP